MKKLRTLCGLAVLSITLGTQALAGTLETPPAPAPPPENGTIETPPLAVAIPGRMELTLSIILRSVLTAF